MTDTEQIIEMLLSTDAQNRRLAFGLIFNNLSNVPSETLLKYKASYFAKMQLDKKEESKGISVSDVIDDMTFVVENLNQNEEDLGKVFMFNPKSIIENVNKKRKEK